MTIASLGVKMVPTGAPAAGPALTGDKKYQYLTGTTHKEFGKLPSGGKATLLNSSGAVISVRFNGNATDGDMELAKGSSFTWTPQEGVSDTVSVLAVGADTFRCWVWVSDGSQG